MLTQRAIMAHVLLMVHRMDDGARTKEEQRLEESVRKQVEHRCAIGTDARCEEHIAQLRTGRISDDFLDVLLRRADGRREEAGRRADIGDDMHRRLAHLEHRRQAADHEYARRNHRCRVDECGNRGRAFHRIRQPGVEAELRRLAHRSNEQQQADDSHRIETIAEETDGRPCHIRRGREDFRDRNGIEHQIGRENAHHEAKVADAVDDERLYRRRIGARLTEPEADEQIGGQTHAFPAEEHLQQIVRGHEHQHREGEEREIGEETRLIRVFVHIAPAIEVDERGNAGDDDKHHRRQRIDPQFPHRIEAVGMQPGQHRHDEAFAIASRQEADEDRPAQRAGDEKRAGRHDLRGDIAQSLVAQPRYDRGDERQENDNLDHARAQPFIWLASSTAMVPRVRK